MTADTLMAFMEYLRQQNERLAEIEERVGVLETVTGDMRSEIDDLNDGVEKDGYLSKHWQDKKRKWEAKNGD